MKNQKGKSNAARRGKTPSRTRGDARGAKRSGDFDGRKNAKAVGAVVGRLDCKGDRFGFVTGEGKSDDLFVSHENLGGARHGDTVRAIVIGNRPSRGGSRREGRVIEVVERNPLSVVATVVFRDNIFCAVPDDRHYGELLEITELNGASEHDKVIIDVVANEYGGDGARVLAVLGRFDEIGMDVKSVIASHNLRTEFPRDVAEQAAAFPETVSPADINAPYRTDFRGETVFTIDGSDSKDFDDAVSLVRTDGGYRLGVYIADVAQYVTDGSPLDREALARGTSVYLADRVIPMLPEVLSNGLCSLNEGVDRLALCAVIDLDVDGRRTGLKLCEGVIRSAARLTYTGVQAILDGNGFLRKKYAALVPTLEQAQERRGRVRFDGDRNQVRRERARRRYSQKAAAAQYEHD